MKVKKIKKDNYDLHLIKQKNFKNIIISVQFKQQFNKKDITCNTMLSEMLIYSTKKYPNKIAMTNKTRDLYGTYVASGNGRQGNLMFLDIYLSLLNPKYTEEQMMDENIDFLKEIIFNPNVNDNKFDSESFQIIKNSLIAAIEGVKDNQARYAQLKMLGYLNATKRAYSYNMDGDLDDLDNITTENLYEYYQRIIKDTKIDIYVIGDISFDEIEKSLDNKLNFQKRNVKTIPIFIENDKTTNIKIYKEMSSFKQSKLSIGCKIEDGNSANKILYPLFIYNNILGGNTNSKLFANVREKNSYAYYINSNFHITDNLIIINAGISKDNYNNVVEMVKHEMEEISKGNFTLEDILSAKNSFNNAMTSLNDSLSSILYMYYSLDNVGNCNMNYRIKKVNEVTKDDIIAVSKKIKIDTIYLLEEDANEKN